MADLVLTGGGSFRLLSFLREVLQQQKQQHHSVFLTVDPNLYCKYTKVTFYSSLLMGRKGQAKQVLCPCRTMCPNIEVMCPDVVGMCLDVEVMST